MSGFLIAIMIAIAGALGTLTFGVKLLQANATLSDREAQLNVCRADNLTLQLNVSDLRQAVNSQNVAVAALENESKLVKEKVKRAQAEAKAEGQARLDLIEKIKNLKPTAEGACERAVEIYRGSFQ